MDIRADVLIVGGGLNGPALALALAQAGFTVALVDRLAHETRLDPGFDGRAYALALASRRLFEALGLWPVLAPESQPILDIHVTDGRPGEGAAPWFLHFDHAEIEEGPMGHMLEDRHLRRVLLATMQAEPGIAQIAPAEVVVQEVGPAGVTLTLGDGRRLEGRVLVGADGRGSGTAARAGIARTGWDYGQTGLVCAVEHELPHGGCAHQFFMPAGPLAILPLKGNRSSIVWTERSALAAEVSAMSDADYLATLRPRFGDFLGAIRLAGARSSYPLSLSIAHSFVAPRLALLGDAAHGVHPIAGQGLNLGLRDVAALAEVLLEARRRGEDIGAADVLARYQRWRRWDAVSLALGMDAVNRLFSNDNPLLRAVRDLGLGAVNALPGVRRRFIREAAGLSGDVPRLMQGRGP
ncbi:MAG: 2-octaprenyl-6-methoxyphenyl hydroxylase [Alphaproteobacteria bacterium HGW-Alphaproteobacteria-2]|nr:MAG: 2-octaprenyl-6-methoxyphenyl hydroxylase [Alphaproteobacteria bacterium HGW-Alphaproteobacteria-2]